MSNTGDLRLDQILTLGLRIYNPLEVNVSISISINSNSGNLIKIEYSGWIIIYILISIFGFAAIIVAYSLSRLNSKMEVQTKEEEGGGD